MQSSVPSNSRKRSCSDRLEGENKLEGESCQTISKKQQVPYIPDLKTPGAHQGNSPSIPLVRRTLRALRRQVGQAESQAKQRGRRRTTRLAVAERKRCNQPLTPVHAYLENCGREQYEALQSFSKHGGPDLRDIRGCQKAAIHVSKDPMASSQADPASRSRSRRSAKTKPTMTTTTGGASSKSISPYSRAFLQILIDSHVFPPYYTDPDGNPAPKPDNWEYINERLAQPRLSLSPSRCSEEAHEDFVRLAAGADKESLVAKRIIPLIEGKSKDIRAVSGEIPFTNLAPLAIDETLVSSNPDIYYGARPEQLHRRIRDALGRFVVPSTQHDLPIVPNHITGVKGPDGTPGVAIRQAMYDTHFGARAVNALQSYGHSESQYDGNAYAFACTYQDGLLKLYTSHPTPPTRPGEQPNYYMSHLGSFAMDHNLEVWKEGATWYRNSIDLAKEMRDEAIRGANEVVNRASSAPFTSDLSAGASFASTGNQIRLDSLTMYSQVADADGTADDNLQIVEGPQQDEEATEEDDEDELSSSIWPPIKRSKRQRGLQRKRRNQGE